MDKNRAKLLEGPIARSLFTLAAPIIAANVLQAAYQLTDAFWVGRLGKTAVASVSVSFPITFLMIALGAGFAVAGSTLIAQYFGAKNNKMVNHVAAQTLTLVAILSIIIGAIGFIFAPSLLNLMKVDADVFQNALKFMRVSFVGLIFVFGFVMFQSIMRGIGHVKIPMAIILGTVILNFALDPLFIFGFGPIKPYGVMGAAMATLGTQAVAALIGLYILLSGKYDIHLKLPDFKPDFAFIKRAFLLGFPASIEQSSRAIGLTVMTFIVASFGTTTVASYGVGSNIMQFVLIFSMGLSMAISVLAGQNIGAGKIERAADIGRLGATISFWFMSVLGVIIFIFASHIIAFFIPNDPTVIALGTTYVRTMALTYGFFGIQMALIGIFRASGNMTLAMMLAIISQWVLQLPIAYVLSKHTYLAVNGLWLAFPITNVIMAAITILWYAKGDWKNKKLTEEDLVEEKVSEEIIVEEGIRN